LNLSAVEKSPGIEICIDRNASDDKIRTAVLQSTGIINHSLPLERRLNDIS